ncbi:hypothetical protein PLESTB_000786600 [Pleodorina starrii]|uniref:Uncharacterized protein n=1 Tax=Pleodorina starrii TaxID=330485 RepID=A0A9W6BLJ0_9CHLO|nr:hypothetical protein PLESTM_000498200 [Pleodorina starrii]GLC53782.1 hypothetical protein PLESTB_000786600 [Pleodorina starrii]GLC72962.1 hypothetical protein PLESTF_001314300 [Pleodorina starrii]
MGKGSGRGRGKGGCECCEAIHALACCLCLVLFGGPILIAVGATLIATGNRNERARSIETVQAAVDAWNDPNSPNGWLQFQKLVTYARFTPGSPMGCTATEKALLVNSTNGDWYSDESGRFGRVKQARLTTSMDYRTFINCNMGINLTQELSGGDRGNASLVYLSTVSSGMLSYQILVDKAGGPRNCATRNDGCGTVNARNCQYNCERYFGGAWSCNAGKYICDLTNVYYGNFAIKVSYQNKNGTSPAGYTLDTVNPARGGGANVLPAGFKRQYNVALLPLSVPTGDLFQLPDIGARSPPDSFSVTVRSSADPWLTYMVVTSGTGYFGVTKRALMATGITLVVVGSLGTLFWVVAAFYAWWMLCSKRRPTERPQGVSGYAWDLANRYGGQYAPALGVPVHATGHNGMPTAQPLYVTQGPYQVPGQPVAGYPPYPYPPPYGAPQPGPYPPYPYAAPYPPPGGNVEMGQFAGGHPQPYGYPPQPHPAPTAAAPHPGGATDGQAPPPQPPPYPYAYPYPPYGGPPPPPAGGAPPPPPPPS